MQPEPDQFHGVTADNTSDTAWHEPETSFGDNAVTGSIRVVGNKAEAIDWQSTLPDMVASLEARAARADRVIYADYPPRGMTDVTFVPLNPIQRASLTYNGYIGHDEGSMRAALTAAIGDLPPHASVEPVRSLAADPHYREDLPKTVAALEALLALYDRLWDIKR